jgi:hypothetical protein
MTEADPFAFAVSIGAVLDELGIPRMPLPMRCDTSTFSAIHIETFLRIDFFPIGDLPAVRREQLARGRVMALPAGTARFYAPEDIVVQKLRWYRMGGPVSDQQWRDVSGVLRVNGDLDQPYLDRAAEAFGVRDLLDLARQDADN